MSVYAWMWVPNRWEWWGVGTFSRPRFSWITFLLNIVIQCDSLNKLHWTLSKLILAFVFTGFDVPLRCNNLLRVITRAITMHDLTTHVLYMCIYMYVCTSHVLACLDTMLDHYFFKFSCWKHRCESLGTGITSWNGYISCPSICQLICACNCFYALTCQCERFSEPGRQFNTTSWKLESCTNTTREGIVLLDLFHNLSEQNFKATCQTQEGISSV